MKTCRKCGIEKPLKQFYVCKGYVMARCKDCVNEASKLSASKKRVSSLPFFRLPSGELIQLNFDPIKDYEKLKKLQGY
jgi:hypothetical protein